MFWRLPDSVVFSFVSDVLYQLHLLMTRC